MKEVIVVAKKTEWADWPGKDPEQIVLKSFTKGRPYNVGLSFEKAGVWAVPVQASGADISLRSTGTYGVLKITKPKVRDGQVVMDNGRPDGNVVEESREYKFWRWVPCNGSIMFMLGEKPPEKEKV